MDILDFNRLYDAIKAIKFLRLSVDIGFEDAYNKLLNEADELKHHKFERKTYYHEYWKEWHYM